MTNVTVDRMLPSDREAVLALLRDCDLPSAGIDDVLASGFIARDGTKPVGCAAIEPYGAVALLRSVAVAEAYRERGLGRRLVERAKYLAKAGGAERLYLLTETAESYFARLGFNSIDRALVPPAVRASVEFVEACPDTAIAMERAL